MALIDSGCRLRFEAETMKRFRLASWGLLIRLPRLDMERSAQFLRVRVVIVRGQGKEDMGMER